MHDVKLNASSRKFLQTPLKQRLILLLLQEFPISIFLFHRHLLLSRLTLLEPIRSELPQNCCPMIESSTGKPIHPQSPMAEFDKDWWQLANAHLRHFYFNMWQLGARLFRWMSSTLYCSLEKPTLAADCVLLNLRQKIMLHYVAPGARSQGRLEPSCFAAAPCLGVFVYCCSFGPFRATETPFYMKSSPSRSIPIPTQSKRGAAPSNELNRLIDATDTSFSGWTHGLMHLCRYNIGTRICSCSMTIAGEAIGMNRPVVDATVSDSFRVGWTQE